MVIVEPNGIYNIDEVCEILHCSETTLWRIRKKGLPTCSPCGTPRFLGSDILAYMKTTRMERTEVTDFECRSSKAQRKLKSKLAAMRA